MHVHESLASVPDLSHHLGPIQYLNYLDSFRVKWYMCSDELCLKYINCLSLRYVYIPSLIEKKS